MKKDAASDENDVVAEDTEKPKDRVRKSGCCKCINPNHPSMLTLLIYYPGNHILSVPLYVFTSHGTLLFWKDMQMCQSKSSQHVHPFDISYIVARRNFSLITFNWLANALVYNGLSFYSANLNVSSHLGFFISSAVEIPSYFLGWYFMDRWGRRWILFATMMTGGVSCICCMFVPLGKCITVSHVKIEKIKQCI